MLSKWKGTSLMYIWWSGPIRFLPLLCSDTMGSNTFWNCIIGRRTTLVQLNLRQKLVFLHQLTHNMTTDCSLNYKFNTNIIIPSSNLGRTCCVQILFLTFRTIFVHNMFSPCSAKRRASDKDLPVYFPLISDWFSYSL